MRTPTKHSVKMMNFGALIHVTWKTPSISWFTSISVAKWRISSVSEIINGFFLVCMSLPCAWISATSINCHLRGKPQGGGWRECHLVELRMLLWSGVTFKGNLGICDLYNARDCVSVMKNPRPEIMAYGYLHLNWIFLQTSQGRITVSRSVPFFYCFPFLRCGI